MKKYALPATLLTVSVLVLIISNISLDNFTYSVGKLTPQILIWVAVLGAITFVFRKKVSPVLLFSILFLLATLFDFSTYLLDQQLLGKYRSQTDVQNEEDVETDTETNPANSSSSDYFAKKVECEGYRGTLEKDKAEEQAKVDPLMAICSR